MPPAPIVHLGSSEASLYGKVYNVQGSDQDVNAFLGVPYAEPPIGVLRFRSPQQLRLWSGIKDATKYGPVCPQDLTSVRRNYGYVPGLPTAYSEDCLYLNVWTPCCTSPGQRLPVLVWIHGGAFVFGFSNICEGAALAAYENVVVVTINYRLGVFGFLRTGPGDEDYHGNMGLLDQIEALRWVQRYIRDFGGDPENVTVIGESAGGISISLHQMSKLTRGLFHRSIIQSGSCLYGNVLWSKAGTEKYFHKRLERMGYKANSGHDVSSFMANKSTSKVIQAFNDWFVPSVLDGDYLTEEPLLAYTEGRVHAVDCLIGYNSTEGVSFVPPIIDDYATASKVISNTISKNFYRGHPATVTKRICELANDVYVKTPRGIPKSVVSDMYGDINFVAPSVQQADLHSKRGRTYVYLFDHRPSASKHPDWVRADHANEIPFVFGFPFRSDMAGSGRWTKEEEELSRTMMSYWANFARTGNPNVQDAPLWPQYSRARAMYLPFRLPQPQAEDMKDFIPDRIKLWNTIVPNVIKTKTDAKY